MGYNHYRFARRLASGIAIKSPDVALHPLIELQDTGAIVLRALDASAGKIYLSKGANHALAVYVDTDSVIDTVSAGKNLYLKPEGAGVVKFGTYTATPATDSTGFITIKDSGGTDRKIMVQA